MSINNLFVQQQLFAFYVGFINCGCLGIYLHINRNFHKFCTHPEQYLNIINGGFLHKLEMFSYWRTNYLSKHCGWVTITQVSVRTFPRYLKCCKEGLELT